MNKILFHRIIIAILLVLNVFLVFRIVGHKKHGYHSMREGKGPKKMIAKKLNFDKDQLIDFEELIEEHHQEVRKLDQEMRTIKHNLLKQLSDEEINSEDSLYQQIGELQARVEKAHIQHFLAIKSLCKEDQLKDFEELNQRLVEMFEKRRERGKRFR